jgi:hypothetical protein
MKTVFNISNNVNHPPGETKYVKKLSGANSAGGNSEEILKALRPSEYHSKTEKRLQ